MENVENSYNLKTIIQIKDKNTWKGTSQKQIYEWIAEEKVVTMISYQVNDN